MNNPIPRSTWRLALACCLLAFAGGCVDWSGDPALYRKILDGPQPAARPAFDPAQPLPLARALALANADNEAIASRGEDYIQSLAEKMRQAGTFLPTLTLAPSYTLTDTHGVSTSGGAVAAGEFHGGTSHAFSVPASLSATGSLSNASNLQAAGYTVEQRAQLLLDERETVLLQTVESYYAVLRAERQADVYVNGLKLKAEKVRDQQARLKLGNVKPLDLAQSQADLAGTRAQLTQSRTDSANARSALARLMGVPAVTGPLLDAFEPPTNLRELDAWRQQSLTRRQDLLAAARNVESARAALEAAIRQYFPSISINYSYFLYNDPSSAQHWTGALSANVPVFSALSIEAGIRRAWSVYRQAALAQSQARRQVIDDVNQSFQNLQGSRARIIDLQIQVEAAQRAFDLSERAYQLGSVSNLDRLTQQDSLLLAQLNLVNEQFSQKVHYLSLLRSGGQLASVLDQTQ